MSLPELAKVARTVTRKRGVDEARRFYAEAVAQMMRAGQVATNGSGQ
jgi:hypothetical protein